MPFDEIAEIVGRTPAATRQLAGRARRRVRGADPITDADLSRRREIVDAFLAASRGEDFEALLTVCWTRMSSSAPTRQPSTRTDGKITGIEIIADPERISEFDILIG